MKKSIEYSARFVILFLMAISILLVSGCKPAEVILEPELQEIEALEEIAFNTTSHSSPEEQTAFFDFDHQSNGLILGHGGDVDIEIIDIGESGEKAFRTGNGEPLEAIDGNPDPDNAMRFDVDDGFIFAGQPGTHVEIEIEYFDQGTDSFNLEYDSLGGDGDNGNIFTSSEPVTKTNTGEFKIAVFNLDDAHFANRQHGGDFRIWDQNDGPETIRRVTFTLLMDGFDHTSTDIDDAEQMQVEEGQASIVFYNGRVLTMEGDVDISALAVRDEYILDVGSDAGMLALAGPATTQVDLRGRTLMPGFVDAHNHFFQRWEAGIENGQDYLLSVGTTTTAELFVDEGLLQQISMLDQQGKLRVRVSLYPTHVDACGEVWGDWYSQDFPASLEPGAMLQIPGIKIYNDGGACNVPAVSFDYLGERGYGDLYFSVEELTDMVLEVQGKGYQAAIHSLGDRAIDTTQQALIAALDGGPNIFHHRIEHNTLLRDDLLMQYSEHDIVALIFGSFPAVFFSSENYVTPEEFRYWEWSWRRLLDANPNAHFAWHSDTPVMGFPADPIQQLAGFVTRKQLLNDGTVINPPDWAANDILTVAEALPIMTTGSAYALRRENEIGSLAPGKLADIIILSENPFDVDPDAIRNIQVLMTMVGGEVEFCRDGSEIFCP